MSIFQTIYSGMLMVSVISHMFTAMFNSPIHRHLSWIGHVSFAVVIAKVIGLLLLVRVKAELWTFLLHCNLSTQIPFHLLLDHLIVIAAAEEII